MTIEPVPGRDGLYHILEGVNLINEWLCYDPDKEISQLNSPQLYISDKCGNLIECLKMWTGAQGNSGASKDFIDLLRYLAMVAPEDVSHNHPMYAGGAY